MGERVFSFEGTVDAYGDGICTIVIGRRTEGWNRAGFPAGDKAHVTIHHKPQAPTPAAVVHELEMLDTELLTNPAQARRRLLSLRAQFLEAPDG